MLKWRDERAWIGSRLTVIGKDGENSCMSSREGLIVHFRHYFDRTESLPRGCFSQQLWCWVPSGSLAIRLAIAADNETTGFHFLAADPSLRPQLRNANVIPGQATFVGTSAAIGPIVGGPLSPYMYPGSVVTDPANGQWRMYYEVFKSENERFVALATSGDGVHWIKPQLDITGTTYTRDRHNNFVQSAQTWVVGPNVFVKLPPAPVGERYRMTTGVGTTTLYADASADGLHWRQVAVITSGETDVDWQNTAFRIQDKQ